MAIRKIPLKEQPYLPGTDFSNACSSDKVEDPSVETFQECMRRTLLTDRALHDKVPLSV
jgi:ATP-dependent RNA helicase DDX55/SPB4